MSLDAITSSRDITFMELGAPVQALTPGLDSGAQIGSPVLHERMTWAFGLFGEGLGSDYGDASQNFARAITRLTCLPMYHPDPSSLAPPNSCTWDSAPTSYIRATARCTIGRAPKATSRLTSLIPGTLPLTVRWWPVQKPPG